MLRMILLLLVLGFASARADLASRATTITNPVIVAGADPWVIRHEGQYYLSQSRRGASIWINRFERLSDIGQSNWVNVWTPPANRMYSRNLWAPELRFLRANWYIYFAADDGRNENHRMYVLRGTSQNPQEMFEFKGKIAAEPDRWAIDGTVLEMPDGRLFFIWSGWEGLVDGEQCLYIAPMSDPLTITGERVRISRPDQPWELKSRIAINEGPQTLWNGTNLFVIFSASGSWTDDYCLGQLTWTGGDPLDACSWIKKRDAVFMRTESVFGPGHCSFVTSRDGKENWIVYHSAQSRGSGWRRQINMQPFRWNEDGSPNFGEPLPPGKPIAAPSGDYKVP